MKLDEFALGLSDSVSEFVSRVSSAFFGLTSGRSLAGKSRFAGAKSGMIDSLFIVSAFGWTPSSSTSGFSIGFSSLVPVSPRFYVMASLYSPLMVA
jgi:hypothetical protein